VCARNQLAYCSHS